MNDILISPKRTVLTNPKTHVSFLSGNEPWRHLKCIEYIKTVCCEYIMHYLGILWRSRTKFCTLIARNAKLNAWHPNICYQTQLPAGQPQLNSIEKTKNKLWINWIGIENVANQIHVSVATHNLDCYKKMKTKLGKHHTATSWGKRETVYLRQGFTIIHHQCISKSQLSCLEISFRLTWGI